MLVLFIPSSVVSFFLLSRANQKLETQTLTAIHDSNASYMNQLDESFRQIYHLDYQLMDNYEWVQFDEKTSRMSDYEKFAFINSILDKAGSAKDAHPLIDSVHIYFPKAKTVYHSPMYAYGSFTSLDEQQNRQYGELVYGTDALKYYRDPISDGYVLSLVMPPSSSAIDYAVILTLSAASLQKIIEDNSAYDQDYYYFDIGNGIDIGNGMLLTNMDQKLETAAVSMKEQVLSENAVLIGSPPYKKVTIDGRNYYAFFYSLTYSAAYYIRLLPASFLTSLMMPSYIMITILCFLLLAACILFLFGIYRMVHKPLTTLTLAFTQVEQGNFTVQTEPVSDSDFGYVFQKFNHMVSRLDALIDQNYTQTVLLQKAELKQLQAQINPHFLYNSFFMLQKMIKWDSEQAEEIANALGRYFQYITRNSNELVSLSDEYAHAMDYIYIQELRFSGRIQVRADAFPEKFAHVPVPKLILQPVLENAFKHGLKNKESSGIVQISFQIDPDSPDHAFMIRIEDNGDSLSDNALEELSMLLEQAKGHDFNGEMTGMLNIQKRLLLFSHADSPMGISRSELGGLAVEIVIRAEKGAES